MSSAQTVLDLVKDELAKYSDALTTASIIISALVAIGFYIKQRVWKKWRVPTFRELLKTEITSVRGHKTLTRATVTIGDLIDDPFLWVEPRFIDLEGMFIASVASEKKQIRVEDLCEILLDNAKSVRVSIIGSSSRGKSTFARKLFCKLATEFLEGHHNCYPIFVDFATKAVQTDRRDHAQNSSVLPQESVFDRIATVRPRKIILIADGMDEAFYSGRHTDVLTVIKLLEPTDVSVTFVRPMTFIEFIKYNTALTPIRTFQFADYDKNRLLSHASAILERVWNISRDRLLCMMPPLIEAVKNGVITTPMHIAMAVDISLNVPGNASFSLETLASIYGRYIESLIQREASALQNPIKSYEVLEVLEELCGTQVLHVTHSNTFQSSGIMFRLAEINEACETVMGTTDAKLVTWFTERSLLERDTATVADCVRWKFSHPSFVDFFVARHVLHQLQSNAIRTAKLMEVHLPQEVYAFLKMFLKFDTDLPRRAKIINVAQTVYQDCLGRAQRGDPIAELQIEQIAHLVAHIPTPEAITFARHAVQEVETPFISRGVAIGLSFAGVEEDLFQYVEDLEEEYQERGLGPKNTLNLVHQLLYFGDIATEFPMHSATIMINTASQTLSKLLSQLQIPLHCGSRAVDLYTIEVLIRLAKTNPALEAEIRLIQPVISNLLSAPHLESVSSSGGTPGTAAGMGRPKIGSGVNLASFERCRSGSR